MAARFDPAIITLREVPGSNLKKLVGGDLHFVDSAGSRWTAPDGTLTDGASVPRVALGVTDGRFESMFLKAAVVHDAYCQDINMGRNPPFYSRNWRDTHRMFYAACRAGGTPRLRARIMFAAVWWGGPRWGDPVAERKKAPTDIAQIGLSATKHWIEAEEPSLADIEADVDLRETEIVHIYNLQMRALQAMDQGDTGTALEALLEADADIALGLSKAPDDLMYMNMQAYQHKNWGMIRPQDLDTRLELAEGLFRGVITAEPRDPAALNGLGSVAILRKDFDGAKVLIHEALEIEPDYPAALHDLEQIEAFERRLEPD